MPQMDLANILTSSESASTRNMRLETEAANLGKNPVDRQKWSKQYSSSCERDWALGFLGPRPHPMSPVQSSTILIMAHAPFSAQSAAVVSPAPSDSKRSTCSASPSPTVDAEISSRGQGAKQRISYRYWKCGCLVNCASTNLCYRPLRGFGTLIKAVVHRFGRHWFISAMRGSPSSNLQEEWHDRNSWIKGREHVLSDIEATKSWPSFTSFQYLSYIYIYTVFAKDTALRSPGYLSWQRVQILGVYVTTCEIHWIESLKPGAWALAFVDVFKHIF